LIRNWTSGKEKKTEPILREVWGRISSNVERSFEIDIWHKTIWVESNRLRMDDNGDRLLLFHVTSSQLV